MRTRSFVFTSCIPTHVHHAFLKWVDFIKTFVRALKFSIIADRPSIHTSLHVVYTSYQVTVLERVDRPAIFISHCVFRKSQDRYEWHNRLPTAAHRKKDRVGNIT